MQYQMELAMEKNLSPLKILFQCSGMWPFTLIHRNIIIRVFSNIFGFFNIIEYALVCLGQLSYMVASWPNLSKVTTVVATVLSGNLSTFKLTVLYFKRYGIMETISTVLMTDFSTNIPLIKSAMETEDLTKDPNNSMSKLRTYLEKSMERHLKICKYTFITNAFFVITTLIGYTFLPVSKMFYYGSTHTEDGIMYTPFRATVPFDQTKAPGYVILYLMQSWVSYLTVPGFTGMDTFICWHLILIKRQFEIIIHLMDNLEEYSMASMNKKKTDKRVNLNSDTMEESYDQEMERVAYDLLVQCVEHYDRLMNLLKKLSALFSIVIFAQLLSSAAILCVVFFKYKTDTKERSTYFTYIGAASFQLFMYCWFGQGIINVTSDIGDSVYKIRWYKFSPKFQKSIIMLQRQYQRPITITGLGFTAISLPSFTSILSTAMSYLALLNSFLEEK